MHRESLVVLPDLLDQLQILRPILIGHSDGASIALIYAGAGYPVCGVVAIAPHVFVEERSLEGVRSARRAFEEAGLRDRLAVYHDCLDALFEAWSGIWLDPAFRTWNIEGDLARLQAPLLMVQGTRDQYGSLAQLDAIERAASGPARHLILPGIGHTPYREAPDVVLGHVASFVRARQQDCRGSRR